MQSRSVPRPAPAREGPPPAGGDHFDQAAAEYFAALLQEAAGQGVPDSAGDDPPAQTAPPLGLRRARFGLD